MSRPWSPVPLDHSCSFPSMKATHIWHLPLWFVKIDSSTQDGRRRLLDVRDVCVLARHTGWGSNRNSAAISVCSWLYRPSFVASGSIRRPVRPFPSSIAESFYVPHCDEGRHTSPVLQLYNREPTLLSSAKQLASHLLDHRLYCLYSVSTAMEATSVCCSTSVLGRDGGWQCEKAYWSTASQFAPGFSVER